MTHLFEGLSINQNPTDLDDLSAVLCDINTMFVTSGGHMDDNEAVRCWNRGRWNGGHVAAVFDGEETFEICTCFAYVVEVSLKLHGVGWVVLRVSLCLYQRGLDRSGPVVEGAVACHCGVRGQRICPDGCGWGTTTTIHQNGRRAV